MIPVVMFSALIRERCPHCGHHNIELRYDLDIREKFKQCLQCSRQFDLDNNPLRGNCKYGISGRGKDTVVRKRRHKVEA